MDGMRIPHFLHLIRMVQASPQKNIGFWHWDVERDGFCVFMDIINLHHDIPIP